MTNRSTAVYISKTMLQLAVLSKGAKKAKLVAFDSIEMPQGAVIGASALPVKPGEHKGPAAQKPKEQKEAKSWEALTPFEAQVLEFLKSYNIKEGEVVATALPPELIVIRYFQMPRLAPQEYKTAVPFEARKYLPYKLDDVDFAYTISHDKVASNKMAVTFVAAEKASMANYIRFFENVRLKIGYLEAIPYSLMRFLYYIKDVDVNQTAALVYIGHEGANINLIRNRVLYLTRNMPFVAKAGIAAQMLSPGADAESAKLDNLLAEVRLSFDYFHRQFPEEKIEKMIVWSEDKNIQDFSQKAGKELNVPVKVSNPLQMIEGGGDCPVEYAPACGLALRGLYASEKDINLSPGFKKIETERLTRLAVFEICIAIAVLFMFYISDAGKVNVLQKELNGIKGRFSSGSLQLQDLSSSSLENIKQQAEEKFSTLQQLIKNKVFVSSKLKRISQSLPEGLWLDKIDYSKPRGGISQVLTLTGYAYQPKAEDQIKRINQFLENLKKDSEFSSAFTAINLDSVLNTKHGDVTVSKFKISCSME